MKTLLFTLITFFSIFSFAESGFQKIEKLFNEGQELNLNDLKSIDQGMYVGRCFKYDSDYPYGAFTAFKNMSQDSGPIAVDPLLYIAFGSSKQSDYFDHVVVKDIVEKAKIVKAEKLSDKITYEINLTQWWLHFRQNGNYIVEKNIVGGIEDSFCYFYQFRQK